MNLESFNKRVPFNDVSRRYASLESLKVEISTLIECGPYLNGEHTARFQENFAKYIGADYCLGVSSGTVALELALASLQLPKYSKILVAANSGGYGSIAIQKNQLLPCYIDVNENGILDTESILSATEGVSAVIVTHLYGQTMQLDLLAKSLREKNIFLIEDCAQSAGALIGEDRAGSFGDLSTFSFYPTKNLGAIGDAGAVCTSSPLIYERLKKLREYGWSNRYFAEIAMGGNNRIDEIQALVLNLQLKKLDGWNIQRRAIWSRFKRAAEQSSLRLIGSNSESFVAHLAVIETESREIFQNYMNQNGIDTAIHYPYPDYVQPGLTTEPFRSSLPITERLCSSVVSLPLFPEMTENEILRVENSIANYAG